MCDTMVSFSYENRHSFFAKNSDREPGEVQVVYLSTNPTEEFHQTPYLEKKQKYIDTSFTKLQAIFNNFENPYRAFISRPSWMWGAEMGVNEFGVSIGNEAVFSKEKVDENGILGMDILRLALHNTKTAKEALDFIIHFIESYSQGGDGGYHHTLKYHNSFLIKDFNEAYVLETSKKDWAYKKVDKEASISNAYSIKDDFDRFSKHDDIHFKKKYEDKLFTFFTKGNIRQRYSFNQLHQEKANLHLLKSTLRSHINQNEPKGGMASICVHPGFLIKSETTSSMIVEYYEKKLVVWYTASPNPCVSVFKPFIFSNDSKAFDRLIDIEYRFQYAKRLFSISSKLVKVHNYFTTHIKSKRDELEATFEEIVNKSFEDNNEKDYILDFGMVLELEEDYLNTLEIALQHQ